MDGFLVRIPSLSSQGMRCSGPIPTKGSSISLPSEHPGSRETYPPLERSWDLLGAHSLQSSSCLPACFSFSLSVCLGLLKWPILAQTRAGVL